ANLEDLVERRLRRLRRLFVEGAEDDLLRFFCRFQEGDDSAGGDAHRLFQRIAIGARRDAAERDAGEAVIARELQAAPIAGGEQRGPVLVAAAPARPDGVNDVARLQPVAERDLGVAGVAAVEAATLLQQLRPRPTVDRPVYAAAAEQRGIGG